MNDILFAQKFAKELSAESQGSIKCLERINPARTVITTDQSFGTSPRATNSVHAFK